MFSTKPENLEQVVGRLMASAKERDATRRYVAQGHIIQANGVQRLEKRKARLLNTTSFANLIPEGLREELAEKPLAEASDEAQHAFEVFVNGSDLQPAWFLTRGAEVRQTVGRIWVRENGHRAGWGTGFLIAPNLLVTNHHVFPSVAVAQESLIEFEYEETYNGEMLASAKFALLPSDFYVSSPAKDGLDYAVVAVAPLSRPTGDGTPSKELSAYGYNRLVATDGKLIKGEPIYALHHPEGQPRQVCLRNNRLMALDEPRLEGKWMHYETDTQRGSSGAPLFNSQWQVVGIHHRGAEARNEAGEIVTVDNTPWLPGMGADKKHWYANEGLRLSCFLKDLQEQVESLIQSGLPANAKGHALNDQGKLLYDAFIAGLK